MYTIPFSETQSFRQAWIWVLLPIIFVTTALTVITTIGSGSFWNMLFVIGLQLVIMLLFLQLKLRTRIDESGVHYKFSFFHFKERHIPWSDVQKAYVRKYSPLREYGGWGIRFGLRGRAFNVSGDMGLQLELTNGKKILIGTQKPAEIEDLLKFFSVLYPS